jgi:hypothetical protein
MKTIILLLSCLVSLNSVFAATKYDAQGNFAACAKLVPDWANECEDFAHWLDRNTKLRCENIWKSEAFNDWLRRMQIASFLASLFLPTMHEENVLSHYADATTALYQEAVKLRDSSKQAADVASFDRACDRFNQTESAWLDFCYPARLKYRR